MVDLNICSIVSGHLCVECSFKHPPPHNWVSDSNVNQTSQHVCRHSSHKFSKESLFFAPLHEMGLEKKIKFRKFL